MTTEATTRHDKLAADLDAAYQELAEAIVARVQDAGVSIVFTTTEAAGWIGGRVDVTAMLMQSVLGGGFVWMIEAAQGPIPAIWATTPDKAAAALAEKV